MGASFMRIKTAPSATPTRMLIGTLASGTKTRFQDFGKFQFRQAHSVEAGITRMRVVRSVRSTRTFQTQTKAYLTLISMDCQGSWVHPNPKSECTFQVRTIREMESHSH